MKVEFTAKKEGQCSQEFCINHDFWASTFHKEVRRNIRIQPTKNRRWYSAETQQTSFLVLHSLSQLKVKIPNCQAFNTPCFSSTFPLRSVPMVCWNSRWWFQPFSWKEQQTYRHLYRCIWPPSFCVIFSKHIEQHMPKTCRVINHIHLLKGLKKPQCEPQPPPDLHQTGLGHWFGHFFFDPCQDWLDISPVERLVQIPIGSLC